MPRIIVIGSSNTDMVIKSKKLPAPGETILGAQASAPYREEIRN